MKRNIFKPVAIALLPLLVIIGCSKKFLDVPPQGQLTEEQALIDPNAADKLVGGVYNTLYFGGFGNTTVGLLFALTTDVASDDADKGSSPSDFESLGDVDNFTTKPDNFPTGTLWSGHYQAINRCNKALDILDKSTIETGIRNRLAGEVRYLRGSYYFNMVRLFGGVPKLTRVPLASEVNNPAFQTRASKDSIYATIIADLQYAVDNLPLKGEAGSNVGRATKGAAQGMLAKVYMYQKNWQKVYDLTNAVITSGKYSLAPDYALIFREVGANNNESIFEVQTGPSKNNDGGCDGISPLYSNGQGPRAKGGWTNNVDGKQYDGDIGFGFNTPTANLAGIYEPNDTRRAATIIFVNPTGGTNAGTLLWDGFRIPTQDTVENSRYSYKAYHSPFKETAGCGGYLDKDNKPKNIRIMRYAEVLLMNAEAAANLGNVAVATTSLNLVRARAGITPSTGTIANIWKERRVELAMEQDRFFDLVRQGRAGTILRAAGKAFVDGKHEIFPIPQAQRDLSGGLLSQNPGY